MHLIGESRIYLDNSYSTAVRIKFNEMVGIPAFITSLRDLKISWLIFIYCQYLVPTEQSRLGHDIVSKHVIEHIKSPVGT